MRRSWNKFCYTGGYVEAAVQLPGNDQASGFWVRADKCMYVHAHACRGNKEK